MQHRQQKHQHHQTRRVKTKYPFEENDMLPPMTDEQIDAATTPIGNGMSYVSDDTDAGAYVVETRYADPTCPYWEPVRSFHSDDAAQDFARIERSMARGVQYRVKKYER